MSISKILAIESLVTVGLIALVGDGLMYCPDVAIASLLPFEQLGTVSEWAAEHIECSWPRNKVDRKG